MAFRNTFLLLVVSGKLSAYVNY